MALKFYKGESISLLFNSGDADLSGYNKKIRLFTPLSDILEKDVTPVSANSFSVTISPEETAAFKEGGFNIVLVLTSISDTNVVRIGKSVPAVFLDPDKINPDCYEEANNNLSLSISLGTEVTGINIDGGNFIVLVDGADVEPYIREAVDASDKAQASATAAAESESNAAASATAAETAKTGTETDKTASEAAKTAAETAANKIDGFFETWSSDMIGKVYPFCCIYDGMLYRVISGQTTTATDIPGSTSTIWEEINNPASITFSDSFNVKDADGNIAFKIDEDGVKAKLYNICDEYGNIVKVIDYSTFKALDGFDSGRPSFYIKDKNGNIPFIVDKQGVKARLYNICDSNGTILKVVNYDLLNSFEIAPERTISYKKGTSYSFADSGFTTSSGVTATKNITSKKHGSFSVECDILNSDTDNYIIIDIPTAYKSGSNFGFWLYIDQYYLSNITSFFAQILNASGVVQTQIYSWGNSFFIQNSTLNTRDIAFLGGWMFFQINGNTGTKLKLIFRSDVTTGSKIASILVDGVYFIEKRITPVMLFAMDGAYSDTDATTIYNYLNQNGFKYSICGNINNDVVLKHVRNGTCEKATYGGNITGLDNQIIPKSDSYTEVKSAIDTVLTLDLSMTSSYLPVPTLFGCQFHKFNHIIAKAVENSGYRAIKAGGFIYQNPNAQQIFDYNNDRLLHICPSSYGTAISDSTSIATAKSNAKAFIDNVVKYGTVGLIFNHNFSTDPASKSNPSLYTNNEVMIYMIDYIKTLKDSGSLLVMSTSELVNNLKTK